MPIGPRWLALALLASLGGNMFLAGFMLGHRPSPHGPPDFGPPPFDFPGGPPPGGGHGGPPPPPPNPLGMMERLLERLPADDAEKMRKIFDPHLAEFRAEEERHHDFPRRLRAALAAEPFDRAAFEAVLSRHDEAERSAHERMRALIVEAAAALSPEGRRRLSALGPR